MPSITRIVQSFFDALPAAAASPLALLAYLAALVAAVILLTRYRRIQALASLPAKDRAEALKRETRYGSLGVGLTGEQWTRHERSQSILIMGLTLLGVILIVTIVAMTHPRQAMNGADILGSVPPKHLLRVISNPEEALVSIDGQWTGETPYEKELLAGEYTVTIQKEGYRTVTKHVSIPKQNLVSVVLNAQ